MIKLFYTALFAFLAAGAVIFDTAADKELPLTPKNLKNKCLTREYEKYPPPADTNQLPVPIKSCVQMIENLCKTNKNVEMPIIEQIPPLMAALNSLRKAIPYYQKFEKAEFLIDDMDMLFDHRHLAVFWQYIDTKWRVDVAHHFLRERIMLYNWEGETGPERFTRYWQCQIYKGLYCISKGKRPPLPLSKNCNKMEQNNLSFL